MNFSTQAVNVRQFLMDAVQFDWNEQRHTERNKQTELNKTCEKSSYQSFTYYAPKYYNTWFTNTWFCDYFLAR